MKIFFTILSASFVFSHSAFSIEDCIALLEKEPPLLLTNRVFSAQDEWQSKTDILIAETDKLLEEINLIRNKTNWTLKKQYNLKALQLNERFSAYNSNLSERPIAPGNTTLIIDISLFDTKGALVDLKAGRRVFINHQNFISLVGSF